MREDLIPLYLISLNTWIMANYKGIITGITNELIGDRWVMLFAHA